MKKDFGIARIVVHKDLIDSNLKGKLTKRGGLFFWPKYDIIHLCK
jgi:hypothetical protein